MPGTREKAYVCSAFNMGGRGRELLLKPVGGIGNAIWDAWPARSRALAAMPESILGKLSAIAPIRDFGKRADGWDQDEAGHWIPPGRRGARDGGRR